MKNKFIKISKLCIVLFFIAIAILVGAAMLVEEQEIMLHPVLGIFVLLSILGTVICLTIAILLDLIANFKKQGFAFLPSYIIVIVGVWIAITLIDYMIGSQGVDLLKSFVQATTCVCGIRAGNYIFSKQN